MIKGKAFQEMKHRQQQRPQRPSDFRALVSKPANAYVEFIDRSQQNWGARVEKTHISGDKVSFLLHNGDMKVFNFQEILSIHLKPLETEDAQNRSNPR